MDIKNLIESGSLDLYVLGALSPEETREIDALRKTHQEVNDEILRIEDAMIAYSELHAVKPAAETKEKIMHRLGFSPVAEQGSKKAEPIQIQLPGIYRLAAAAAIALIVALGGTTFYYDSKYNEATSQLLALTSEKTQMANQVKYITTESEKMKVELAVAGNPENRKIALNGLPISPSSKAIVYWDKETGQAYINSALLPQVDSNQQFQLWAIVNGKPVDMGVIAKDSAFSQMKSVQGATAFAITLEPVGGRAMPTLEKMYVMGAV